MNIITRELARAKGMQRYFTGTPCVNGHVAERRVCNNQCVPCALACRRAWAKKNESKGSVNYSKNREKARKYWRDWAARNKDKIQKYNAKFRRDHPEKVKEAVKNWEKNNREAKRVLARRNYRRNKQTVLDRNRSLRDRRRGAAGNYTPSDICSIANAQRNRCAYCRVPFSTVKRHIDHIKPISKGGTNDRRNLQLLCQTCNLEKHARDPIDFARIKGRLL